ncbi:MAG TPA: hypothetical protein VN420_03210 [Candidatus Fimivivens sp.]|nr:hypothetical protein [Candidatus Fimivivens sp.]
MISNRSGRGGGMVDRDRANALHRLQSEFAIFEQDLRKKRLKSAALTAEIRRLRADVSRLSVTLREKLAEDAKLAREVVMLEAEGSRLKKQINQASR